MLNISPLLQVGYNFSKATSARMLLKTCELEPFLYPCSHEQIVFRYAGRLSPHTTVLLPKESIWSFVKRFLYANT
jgi:hypothetical protein